MDSHTDIERDGFHIAPNVLHPTVVPELEVAFADALGARPGRRDALRLAVIRELTRRPAIHNLAAAVLGDQAFAYRATLFAKSTRTNWLVGWHQDLVVPVRSRIDTPGYGPWSNKGGNWFVQPPEPALENSLAVRVDLDGSDARNGALRVIPGSHRHGVLSRSRIDRLTTTMTPTTCAVPAGGALLMRPLLLHASSRCESPKERRIVHIEFASAELPEGPVFADSVTP